MLDGGRQQRHAQFSRFGADRLLPREDVVEPVEREVGAEQLKLEPLRFEGDDATGFAGEARQRHRVGADIGARLDDDGTGSQQLPQHRDLTVRVFAVLGERSADERIAAVEQHRPVPALAKPV